MFDFLGGPMLLDTLIFFSECLILTADNFFFLMFLDISVMAFVYYFSELEYHNVRCKPAMKVR